MSIFIRQSMFIKKLNTQKMIYLIFDVETTGLPQKNAGDFRNKKDTDKWPGIVQIAWVLYDDKRNLIEEKSSIINRGLNISMKAEKLHGITEKIMKKKGESLEKWLLLFLDAVKQADMLIAHNINFDWNTIGSECKSCNIDYLESGFTTKPQICTMIATTHYVGIPHPWDHEDYKWPSLDELYKKLFSATYRNQHNAINDVSALAKSFFALITIGELNPKEWIEDVPISDEYFLPKPRRKPRQLPEGIKEDSIEGIEWICMNSKSKKKMQFVIDILKDKNLTIDDIAPSAKREFVKNSIKKRFDFLPKHQFAHSEDVFGKKISSFSTFQIIEIWNDWGLLKNLDFRLKYFDPHIRDGMEIYYTKVQENITRRKSFIFGILKLRKHKISYTKEGYLK